MIGNLDRKIKPPPLPLIKVRGISGKFGSAGWNLTSIFDPDKRGTWGPKVIYSIYQPSAPTMIKGATPYQKQHDVKRAKRLD